MRVCATAESPSYQQQQGKQRNRSHGILLGSVTMYKRHSALSASGVCSRTGRIDHRQAHVAFHNVGTGGGQIPNINARSCWIKSPILEQEGYRRLSSPR